MANYYFLATLLPPLRVGSPVELGSQELAFLLEQNLQQDDLALIHVLKRARDMHNIQALWQKQPFMPGGNLDQHDLEERLFFKEGLPDYIVDYLEEYPDKQERLTHFSRLLQRYFATESKTANAFLSWYITLEWQSRLVFVVLRALDLGRDVAEELDVVDPFVEELITLSREKNFEPPSPYTSLKALYEARKEEPLDLFQALSEWRFNAIEERIEWENFSMERILGYVAQLEICEQWLQLDKLKGLEIVEEMMEVV